MGKYVQERHCLELQTKEKRRFFGRKYENKSIQFERRVLWSNEIKFEEIDRQVAKRKPTNQEQFFQIVQNIWNNMEPGSLLKLCASSAQSCDRCRRGYFDEKYALREYKNQPVY